MSKRAEDSITKTLIELPGTSNWTPGSCRKVAQKILNDLGANGAVITFYETKTPIVVPSKQDIAMRRLVKMDRMDRGFMSKHAEDLIRELKIHAEKLEHELKAAHDYIRGCPVHGTALCPEEYMLNQDGTSKTGYSNWHELFRCGRRPPRPILTKENNETNK